MRRQVPDGWALVIVDCVPASEVDLGHGIALLASTSEVQVMGNSWELWEGKLGRQNSGPREIGPWDTYPAQWGPEPLGSLEGRNFRAWGLRTL